MLSFLGCPHIFFYLPVNLIKLSTNKYFIRPQTPTMLYPTNYQRLTKAFINSKQFMLTSEFDIQVHG